jgi:hypothetical protein
VSECLCDHECTYHHKVIKKGVGTVWFLTTTDLDKKVDTVYMVPKKDHKKLLQVWKDNGIDLRSFESLLVDKGMTVEQALKEYFNYDFVWELRERV